MPISRYKGDMKRETAENLLLTPPLMTGKFLIRDRIVKGTKIGYTVSFLMPCDFKNLSKGHIVQHLTAREIGPLISIGDNLEFWSLNQLVDHFSKNPITKEGSVKLTMICKDGAHKVSNYSSSENGLNIQLSEAYPYENDKEGLKIMLLKGFKLTNAVKIKEKDREGDKEFYIADFGIRKGLCVVAVTLVLSSLLVCCTNPRSIGKLIFLKVST